VSASLYSSDALRTNNLYSMVCSLQQACSRVEDKSYAHIEESGPEYVQKMQATYDLIQIAVKQSSDKSKVGELYTYTEKSIEHLDHCSVISSRLAVIN
jgi:hypothetical protein